MSEQPPASDAPRVHRPWYANPFLWILVIIAVPFLVAVALAPRSRHRLEALLGEECGRRYAQALTAGDSAAVDTLQPLKPGRKYVAHRLNCGDVRRAGLIR